MQRGHTDHYSLLTTHYSLQATWTCGLMLTISYLLLTTYFLLLATCYLLLTTHYLLLSTCFLLLATYTYYLLLTTGNVNIPIALVVVKEPQVLTTSICRLVTPMDLPRELDLHHILCGPSSYTPAYPVRALRRERRHEGLVDPQDPPLPSIWSTDAGSS